MTAVLLFVEPFFLFASRHSCRCAWCLFLIKNLQPLAKTAEGGASVAELATLLTGCHAETRGEVYQANPGLGSILVLPARATRAKGLDATF